MRHPKSHILLQVNEKLSIPEPYIIDCPKPKALPKHAPELSLPSLAPVDYTGKEAERPKDEPRSVVIIIDL